MEANPEGVSAALERREELLAGGSTPEAAEAVGLDAGALDAAATPALESQPGDAAAAAGPPPGSAARGGFSLRPEQQQQQQGQTQAQQQRGPRQQPSSAAWDAFVAAQAAPQPAQQQPGVPVSRHNRFELDSGHRPCNCDAACAARLSHKLQAIIWAGPATVAALLSGTAQVHRECMAQPLGCNDMQSMRLWRSRRQRRRRRGLPPRAGSWTAPPWSGGWAPTRGQGETADARSQNRACRLQKHTALLLQGLHTSYDSASIQALHLLT